MADSTAFSNIAPDPRSDRSNWEHNCRKLVISVVYWTTDSESFILSTKNNSGINYYVLELQIRYKVNEAIIYFFLNWCLAIKRILREGPGSDSLIYKKNFFFFYLVCPVQCRFVKGNMPKLMCTRFCLAQIKSVHVNLALVLIWGKFIKQNPALWKVSFSSLLPVGRPFEKASAIPGPDQVRKRAFFFLLQN